MMKIIIDLQAYSTDYAKTSNAITRTFLKKVREFEEIDFLSTQKDPYGITNSLFLFIKQQFERHRPFIFIEEIRLSGNIQNIIKVFHFVPQREIIVIKGDHEMPFGHSTIGWKDHQTRWNGSIKALTCIIGTKNAPTKTNKKDKQRLNEGLDELAEFMKKFLANPYKVLDLLNDRDIEFKKEIE